MVQITLPNPQALATPPKTNKAKNPSQDNQAEPRKPKPHPKLHIPRASGINGHDEQGKLQHKPNNQGSPGINPPEHGHLYQYWLPA